MNRGSVDQQPVLLDEREDRPRLADSEDQRAPSDARSSNEPTDSLSSVRGSPLTTVSNSTGSAGAGFRAFNLISPLPVHLL